MNSAGTAGVVPSERAGHSRVLGLVVIGSLACFILALTALHWLRPDVDPLARVTSEYAVGPNGFLMTSAYFALALALAALGAGLARSLPAPARGSAGVLLLFLAAAATAVAGVFPVDVDAPTPVTGAGWVHRIAAIFAFVSMTLAPLVLARKLRKHPDWRGVARLGRFVGATGLLGFLSIQLVLLERGLAGAAQRVVLALVIGWMLVAAFRLVEDQ